MANALHAEVEKLLRLQAADSRLEILRKELEARPRILKGHDDRIADLQRARESAEATIKAMKLEIDRTQLEVKSFESRIQETKNKIPSIKTNQEYAALNAQIARLEGERGAEEERLLKRWEELESLQGKAKQSAEAVARAQKTRSEEGKSLEQEIEVLRKELGEFEAQRQEALAPIARDLLDAYLRLYPRYRDRSVVSADRLICAGCHMTLSPQIANMLRRQNAVVNCTNCARILYLESAPE